LIIKSTSSREPFEIAEMGMKGSREYVLGIYYPDYGHEFTVSVFAKPPKYKMIIGLFVDMWSYDPSEELVSPRSSMW